MAVAVPFIMIAATALSAVSAIQQGRAASKAAKFNAQVASQNAQLSRQQAAAQAEQVDRANRLRLGSIRAQAGKQGGVGNAIDVLGDVAAQGELERQNVLFGGEARARGFESTATLDRFSGRSARRAGNMAAGTALLSGAAGVGANPEFQSFLKRT